MRAAFLRGLKVLGACQTGSRLRSVRLGTSYDLKKTCLVSLERGGAGNGALESGSCPHTKEKKDGCQWGFFTNFDIFSK